MRIYEDFNTALDEIKRDLAEMGITIHPQTMQDKYVADDEIIPPQNYKIMFIL